MSVPSSVVRSLFVGAMALLAFGLLSACASPALAGGAKPSPSSDPRQDMLKFAECMRANGVPNFPDPTSSAGGGQNIAIGPDTGVDPNDPTFKKAQDACGKYLHGMAGGKNPANDKDFQAKLLRFAQCMRENGVPNFPDPSPNGGMMIGPDSGLDPKDPAFEKAQQTCASKIGLPGSIQRSTGPAGGSGSGAGQTTSGSK